MKKGKLIVLEGVSGTGKETQAKLLQKYLLSKKINSQIVYHPSPELKEILKYWRRTRKINHLTEVYLLLADRHDRVGQMIIPALEKGQWVISLRNYVSALVYQGETSSERKWIAREFMRFEPRADKLFYFDIKAKIALQRIYKRHQETKEILGKFETIERLSQKLKEYWQVLKNISHITIDAAMDIESVHRQIIQHVKSPSC